MSRRKKKLLICLGGLAAIAGLTLYVAYPFFEESYQRNMDPIRRDHAHQIADVIREFANSSGQLPFQEKTAKQPFMVLIGHSSMQEDQWANDPVLKRNARWANSSVLESMLSKELGRTIRLPRDPQKVPTFAPNVYIYFVSGNQMTIVSHLKFPSDQAVEYKWYGQPFYAYTISYDFNPNP